MCCNILIEKLKKNPKLDANPQYFSAKTAASENTRKFQLILSKGETGCRIEVDKKLIPVTLGTEKCDFLFQRCKTEDYFFVELKGRDVAKAFSQLKTTITLLKESLEMQKHQCHAFISASKVSLPNYSVQKQKFDAEFRRDYGKELRISSSSPEWIVK